MRPKIGITLDWQEQGSFSKRPHYALRDAYFDIIYQAGGLPFAVPYIADAIDDYLDGISGLIIPGGDYAFPKEWYIDPNEEKPYSGSKRLNFDIAIAKAAIEKDMPLLGICAGMQIIGGVSGCKMTADIRKSIDTKIDHLNEKPAEEYAHIVDVSSGSLLKKIVNKQQFDVNTAHCEAIVKVSDIVKISAAAADGIVEAIELPGKKFIIGVQWHPEFFNNETDPNFALFKALVKEAG